MEFLPSQYRSLSKKSRLGSLLRGWQIVLSIQMLQLLLIFWLGILDLKEETSNQLNALELFGKKLLEVSADSAVQIQYLVFDEW